MSRLGRSVVPGTGDGALVGRAFGSVRTPRAVAKGNGGRLPSCRPAGPYRFAAVRAPRPRRIYIDLSSTIRVVVLREPRPPLPRPVRGFPAFRDVPASG